MEDLSAALGYACLELVNGSYNIGAGYSAGSNYTSSESSNIVIGNVGVTGESNVMRIGTQGSGDGQINLAFMAGITSGTPVSANSPQVVLCDNTGNLTVVADPTSGLPLVSNSPNDPTFQVLGITGGGTGLSSTPTDGQLLIGNTGTSGFDLATLNSGAGIIITNSGGMITIAATGGSPGTVTAVQGDDNVPVMPDISGIIYTKGGTGITTSGNALTSTETFSLQIPVTVSHGGTGATTLTGILTGNGTSAVTANAVTQYGTVVAGTSNSVSSIAPGLTGTVYMSQGLTSNPAFTALPPAFSAVNVQTFTSSGTYTPSSNCIYAYVQICGGGGGGGGAAVTVSPARAVGRGGSGAAYCAKTIYNPTSQTVTIGAAGSGGAAGNNNGTSGGNSSFGSILTANGGGYGVGGASLASPNYSITGYTLVNALATGGDINVPGQAPSYAIIFGGATGASSGGGGGNSFLGSGGPSVIAGVTFSINGLNGSGYGAGGGGGCSAGNIAASGGNGSQGVCVVTEFIQ